MPAIDFLQEWQRAEAACVSAYKAMYAKVRCGIVVTADDMDRLAGLSRDARASYHRYVEHVAGRDLPRPE